MESFSHSSRNVRELKRLRAGELYGQGWRPVGCQEPAGGFRRSLCRLRGRRARRQARDSALFHGHYAFALSRNSDIGIEDCCRIEQQSYAHGKGLHDGFFRPPRRDGNSDHGAGTPCLMAGAAVLLPACRDYDAAPFHGTRREGNPPAKVEFPRIEQPEISHENVLCGLRGAGRVRGAAPGRRSFPPCPLEAHCLRRAWRFAYPFVPPWRATVRLPLPLNLSLHFSP